MEGKWKFIVCPVLIILGIFALANVIQIFTAESRNYGAPRFEREQIVEMAYFDTPFLMLLPVGNTNQMTAQLPAFDFDGTRNDYEILVNGYSARLVRHAAGMVEGVFDIAFFNIYGQLAARASLNIRFEFTSTQTQFSVTSTSTNNELAYLNQWIENLGFRVSVVYRLQILEGGNQ